MTRLELATSTLDLGETADIHPRDKQPVGNPLAAIALARTYHHPMPWTGPIYSSNLFDLAGLHAGPFRTDTFPGATDSAKY